MVVGVSDILLKKIAKNYGAIRAPRLQTLRAAVVGGQRGSA